MGPFSVLLCESHPLLREKIGGLLSRHSAFWSVGQVGDLDALMLAAERSSPDLIFADLKLVRTAGQVEALRARSPRSGLYGLTDEVDGVYLQAASRLGLDGIFARRELFADLERWTRSLPGVKEKKGRSSS